MKNLHPQLWLTAVLMCSHCLAAPLTWTSRVPPVINPLNAVRYINGQFVAVGAMGSYWTSPDGVAWTNRDTGTFSGLNGVIAGSGLNVAVGNALTIATFDAAGNVRLKSGSVENLNACACGNGRFVAVSSGAITTSVDGTNWVRVIPLIGYPLNPVTFSDVTYADGQFMIAAPTANFKGGSVLTSTDGITWTNDLIEVVPPRANYSDWGVSSIAHGNGTYVAIPTGINGYVYTSNDGLTWTSHEIDINVGFDPRFRRVAFANGMFFIVGGTYNIPDSGFIFASSDGTTWEDWTPGPMPAINDITFGNGTYVAVGGGYPGASGIILQSSSVAAGQLSAGRLQPDGFKIKVLGEVGRSYQLQSASEVSGASWSNIFGFTLGQATTNYVDAQATNQPKLFYRVTSP